MKNAYTQNNFLSYILILLSLFLLLFFTKGLFIKMQVALDEQEGYTNELQRKGEELSRLNDLEKILNEQGSEAISDIQGFLGEFSDANILQYLHSYADGVNADERKLVFRDIVFSATTKSDVGLNKTQISVSAIFSSENTLFAFINHLINSNAPYRFYISDFNYPMNESSGNLQITIPLTLYHK